MAPKFPKFTAAEFAAFKKGLAALEKRTVPLTEAGTKSLQNKSPDELVALDELLMGGAKLGEVQGTGVGRPIDTQGPLWAQTAPSIAWGAGKPMSPTKPYRVGDAEMAGQWQPPMMAQREAAQTQAQLNAASVPEAQDNALRAGEGTVQAQEFNSDATYGDPYLSAAESPGRAKENNWPASWKKWENIPAAVGTVATGAAVLGAGQAQAADDWETGPVQGDDWETSPAAEPQAQVDDWETGPAPEMQVETGGAGFYPPPTGMPELLAAPATGAPAAPATSSAQSAYGAPPEAEVPFASAFGGLEKFRTEHALPIMQYLQGLNRAAWFGDDPELAKHGITPKLTGPGAKLRESHPAAAMNIESIGKLALGETELNTLGREGPLLNEATAQAERALGPELGPLYSAAAQSFGTGLSQFPLYIIPGIGKSAVAQGATSGLLTSFVDPEIDVKTGTLGGAAAGGVLGGVFKLGAKLAGVAGDVFRAGGSGWKKGIPAPTPFVPIAVLHAADEPALADAIMQMPEGDALDTILKATPEPVAAVEKGTGAATPRAAARRAARAAKQPVVVAIDVVDGAVVKKGLVLAADGVHSVTPPKNFKGKMVATQKALDAASMDPTNPDFDWFVPGKSTISPDWVARSADEIPSIKSSEMKITPDVYEGSVLVLEGGFGDGTARLYDVKSPELHEKILLRRKLTEVRLPDGRKVRGFEQSEGQLFPPEAAENIPGATKEVVDLTQLNEASIRVMSPNEIRHVVAERSAALELAAGDSAKEAADAAAKQADMMLGGNGSGAHLPPDPPMRPPDPPPPAPHNMDPLFDVKNRWEGSIVKRWLVHPAARRDLPHKLADAAAEKASVDILEKYRWDTYQSLQKVAPEVSKLNPAQRAYLLSDLSRFVEGHISSNKLTQDHPELSRALFDRTEVYKQQIAANEQRLIDSKMLLPGEKLDDLAPLGDDEVEAYATRMFYRDMMKPGEWFKLLKSDKRQWDRLVGQIADAEYSHAKIGPREEVERRALAERHLGYLAGNPKLMRQAAKNKGSEFTDAQGSLKKRGDLTRWELEARGEIDDGFARISETMTRQKQLILQGEVMADLARNPEFTRLGDAATPEMISGPNPWKSPTETNSRQFGAARGMWMHPEVYDAVVTIPLMQKNTDHFFRRAVQIMKWNQTVGNHGSWVRNIRYNFQNMMISGFVNPWAVPVTLGSGLRRFGHDFAAYSKAPGLTVGEFAGDVGRERFQRFMELGIVGSDYSSHEFKTSVAAMTRHLENEARLTGKVNAIDALLPAAQAPGKSVDWLSDKYGAIDTRMKYATALAGLEKGGINLDTGAVNVEKAIKFIGGRYRPGMGTKAIVDQVFRRAAQGIHLSFPMMDRVSPAVAKLAGNELVMAANPYLKVTAEMQRVYAQLPGRLLTEPGMKGTGVAIGVAAGLTALAVKAGREMSGMTEANTEAAFASAPPAMQQFKPGSLHWFARMGNGRIRSVDLTGDFMPLTYLVGDPNANFVTNGLRNLLISPVNGSILEPELLGMVGQTGILGPQYVPPKTAEWQQGAAKAFIDIAARGAVPGTLRTLYGAAAKGEVGFAPPGGRQVPVQPQSPLATGVNMLLGPGTVNEYGNQADMDRAVQSARWEFDEARRAFRAVNTRNEGQSTGMYTLPLDKQEALKKAEAVMNAKLRKLEDLQQKFRKVTP